jgi:hypothetical protein
MDDHLKIAAENVGRYRKSAAQLRFITADGECISGLDVQVTQKTQDSLFGNLVFDLVL